MIDPAIRSLPVAVAEHRQDVPQDEPRFPNGPGLVLKRNNSSGDTWLEAISNDAFNGWHQVGGSAMTYAVVAIGDYFGNGTDNILFRNNSTGDLPGS
jgi:hypothetical protein